MSLSYRHSLVSLCVAMVACSSTTLTEATPDAPAALDIGSEDATTTPPTDDAETPTGADGLEEITAPQDTGEEVPPPQDTLEEVAQDTVEEVAPAQDTLEEVAGPQDTVEEVAAPQDAVEEVAAAQDTVEETGGGPTFIDPCPASVNITGPGPESFHVIGGPFIASATVSGSVDGLSVRWESPTGAVLGETLVMPDGTSSGNLDTTAMPPGTVPIRARVVTADGACAETAEVGLVFCQYEVSDDFATLDGEAWKMFGSSYWDQGGWLEMTGTAQSQRGAVYNPQTDVAAGSVSIAFSMATGGGSGADGFAMTIVQTDSIDELENVIIANALPGSGIGYGVGGAYGDWVGNAFTVEIDTYENVFNGTNELHTDPTPNDHIAITLDGDAGNHLWWTDVGEVEDLEWRSIQVDIIGFHVRVWIDGVMTLDQDFPELEFRGGYIFFSGSTGYYTNYHRFDDLTVLHACQ